MAGITALGYSFANVAKTSMRRTDETKQFPIRQLFGNLWTRYGLFIFAARSEKLSDGATARNKIKTHNPNSIVVPILVAVLSVTTNQLRLDKVWRILSAE